MFSKVTPRGSGEGIRGWFSQTNFYPRTPGAGVQSQWAMVSRPLAGVSAAFSLCASGNVPDVNDLFVGQASSSIAYFANRANAQAQIWTNNLSRVIVGAPGGVTINAPDSFASVNTLLVNGGFGNNGFPVLSVNASSITNTAAISASCGATAAGQQAYFFGVNGSQTGLQINGDGSFTLGGSTAALAYSSSSGIGYQWNNGATVLAALNVNGGLTLATVSNSNAPANSMNCNGYQVVGFNADSTTVSASAAINTTETYVTASYAANGGASAAANQAWKITAYGTCTSTVANVSTFTPRMGTNGTTADTALTTLTCTAAASGTTIPFIYTCWITIRTVGVSGTVYAFALLVNQGTTGISATQTVVSTGGQTTVNTSGTIHVGMSYKSAATTTTSTFQSVIVERLF